MDFYHAKVSALADEGVSGIVGPDEWNAVHLPELNPAGEVWYHDEFIGGGTAGGQVGECIWQRGGAGVSATQAGEAKHPGIHRLATTTATNNGSFFFEQNSGGTDILPIILSDVKEVWWLVRSSATITLVDYFFGLSASRTAPNTNDFVGWKMVASESTNWASYTRSGANTSTNLTGSAMQTSTWYQLEMVKNGSSWDFYINGVLNASHSGSSIPTSALGIIGGLFTRTSAIRTVDVDAFAIAVETGVRY